MKPLVKIVLFTLSSALVSSAVLAHPNDINDHRPEAPHFKPAPPQHDQRPSRDWRVGHRVPDPSFQRGMPIDAHRHRHLPPAGHHQQWYKMHGDYVLVNMQNHHIVQIIRG